MKFLLYLSILFGVQCVISTPIEKVDDSNEEISYEIEYSENDIFLPNEPASNDVEKDETNLEERSYARTPLWPTSTIYYDVSDPQLNSAQKSKIVVCMQSLTRATCLTFRPVSVGLLNDKTRPYIKFKNVGSSGRPGCYSKVGYIGQQFQEISLTRNGCDDGTNYAGSCVHEVMHALGFKHEFQRQDREKYIKFNAQNVERNGRTQDSIVTNYGAQGGDTLKVRFNFNSIMQYDPRAGGRSVNGRTLPVFTPVKLASGVPKPIGKYSSMGQECKISVGDRNIIDRLYYQKCGLAQATVYKTDYMIPGTNCNEKIYTQDPMDMIFEPPSGGENK